MWIDCHAHLCRLSEEELCVELAEAAAAGVSTIISTATDLASAAAVVLHCKTYSALYGAAGISPFETQDLPADWDIQLRSYCKQERIIAVGEIGLDLSNPEYPDFKYQMPAFERQIELAGELCLPVVVHSRGAERQVADICRASGASRVLFHCFTGSRDALKFVLDCGYDVSFSGIITYNDAVRDLVKEVPCGRIFIETDAPYLAPVPHRGKTNRPAWVSLVGKAAAESMGIPPERLQHEIGRNFKRLFSPR
ncbi:MAG: TatD family hydrolase [Chitinispirillaceae bacterium]|nr:TatD family hydrolase [Chitinispirillaceae bacterium]